MPERVSGGDAKFQGFCDGWNKWEGQAFHPRRHRACRHGNWRAGTVFHARRAIAAASSHRSALHDRGECLRHSPVAQFRQFLVIVQIGSAHGHPFQSAGFFRFAPASLFDSYRRSFVTRPLSSAADHRGDIENIVRFVTSNDGVGAEDEILARDTPASCSQRSGGSPRPVSCRLAPRSPDRETALFQTGRTRPGLGRVACGRASDGQKDAD